MLSFDTHRITFSIGDNKYWTIFREILSFFQEIDPRLEYGAASPLNFHLPSYILRPHVSGVVRGGVAEYDPDHGDILGDGKAGDGS